MKILFLSIILYNMHYMILNVISILYHTYTGANQVSKSMNIYKREDPFLALVHHQRDIHTILFLGNLKYPYENQFGVVVKALG